MKNKKIKDTVQKKLYQLNYKIKNKGENYKLIKEQIKNQYTPLDKLKEIQQKKFISIVKSAYNNIPFYKELYDKNNINPDDIKSIKDIKKLPIVTKEMLKVAGIEKTTNKNIPKKFWVSHTTSGSTGQPFFLYSDKRKNPLEYACWMRELIILGYEIGDRIVKIRSHSPKKQRLLTKMINRNLMLNSSDVENNLKKYVNIIRNFNPTVLETYNNTAFSIARYLTEKNDTLDLKSVQIIGSPLYKNQREIMQKAFPNALIAQNYGSAENIYVAYQCEKAKGYHIDITRFVVEIINSKKEAKEGQEGEIIITNLENEIMPFIRYRTKDTAIATKKECDCGRNFPILKNIKGRIVNYVDTKDGKLVRIGEFLVILSKNHKYIDQYQLVRKKKGHIEFKIKPTKYLTKKILNEIESKIKERCKDVLDYNIKIVKKIPLTSSGKAKLVKSEAVKNLGGFDL